MDEPTLTPEALFLPADLYPKTEVAPGVTRQVLGHTRELMLVRVEMAAGAAAPPHRHPHRQLTHVAEGRFKVLLGGHERVLGPGESFQVPADVEHYAECLEAGVLLDCFTPYREDFV